jgi:hypothetical protein
MRDPARARSGAFILLQACYAGIMREYPAWIAPHADHGDPTCPGLILPVINPATGIASIECNDCDFVLMTVPADRAEAVMDKLAVKESSTVRCPYCRRQNLIPGFSELDFFTCRHCAQLVNLHEPPDGGSENRPRIIRQEHAPKRATRQLR